MVEGEMPLGKYFDILVSENIQGEYINNLNHAQFKIYYTALDLDRTPLKDGDCTDLGDINESTLCLYRWDNANEEWIKLTPDLGWVSSTGVDTTNVELHGREYEGYVWADVTHLSLFGLGAASPPEPPQPAIISYAPLSPVNDTAGTDTVCIYRTFNVTANQTVEVSWYLDDAYLHTNESVTEANCTLPAEVAGEYNVSAYAENVNGTDTQTWVWNVQSSPPQPANIVIVSWGNDKTNDDSLHITLNASESVRFNATANQTITTWNWFNNGVAQSNNYDNYTTSWSVGGTYIVSVNATNANGTSDTKTWTVTVNEAPSPCYIATATYGTPLDEKIDVLRDFRDEVLMTNPVGKAFVSTYYATSPPVADALRENEGLRTVTRLTLITPLVYLTKITLNGLWLLFIIGLAAVLLLRRDRIKILKSLSVGAGAIIVFIATIFSLGFVGYALPISAMGGAYLLPFVIPLPVAFTLYTLMTNNERKNE